MNNLPYQVSRIFVDGLEVAFVKGSVGLPEVLPRNGAKVEIEIQLPKPLESINLNQLKGCSNEKTNAD